MRVVFVHGINNQDNAEAWIRREWVTWIEKAAGRPGLFDGVEVVAPFYGKELAALTKAAAHTVAQVVAQGPGALQASDEAFAEAMLAEFASALGVEPELVEQEADAMAVAQGPGGFALIPTLRVIERWWPGTGDFATRFLEQADTYFNRPGAKATIDALVAPALSATEPQIIVAHSLGTVVTFDLLRKQPTDTRLYVTLGSPLPLASVRGKLGRPLTVPKGVGRWLNAIDRSDFVGLGAGLAPPTYGEGIENLTDIKNGFNAHAIAGYLGDQRVARAIVAAMDAAAT
jgi:pimeloyl-ACP methyl ester carboxylesterase